VQGAALSSNIIGITLNPESGVVSTKPVFKQEWTKVEGWALPEVPPLITDMWVADH
jgi:selenium-binding protein 1